MWEKFIPIFVRYFSIIFQNNFILYTSFLKFYLLHLWRVTYIFIYLKVVSLALRKRVVFLCVMSLSRKSSSHILGNGSVQDDFDTNKCRCVPESYGTLHYYQKYNALICQLKCIYWEQNKVSTGLSEAVINCMCLGSSVLF